ncbi:hypothetical protein FH972_023131 [Carpinus fangiana]|uniref:Flotillin-like n=1 Tax=Carpinus fangiana TaxID=176857 RepID=A0A5N6KUA1_9ROSI|nr:hypothetical protein FH972_023131 [Carpinus fangiana]
MGMSYHVAEPNSYLVITGAGISDVDIKKKAWVWPMQKVTKISITPFDFSMTLSAMTIEKLKFSLPAVFTIGPQDHLDSLRRYAILLTGDSDGSPAVSKSSKHGMVGTGRNHVQDIVKGIIEGETRSIVSTMSMEELFRERTIFKKKVIDSVQSELEQFGLQIYNANVKELQDGANSEYFATLSRKAHEGALNQAKIDVADARARGEIGEAEKQSRAKQEIAKIYANTAVLETQRKGEKAVADAALKTKEIGIERELNLERIMASRAAETKDAQLQKEVETQRADMELERLRATTVVAAKIARESAEQKAMADLFNQQKKADAEKYHLTAKADAEKYTVTAQADATKYEKQMEAEANFVSRKADADGISEMAKAYGELAAVMGGPAGLMQYLMIKEGVFEKLALANAKAVQGMAPKISVWNTGNGGEGGADPTATMRNLFQNLPPLLGTIQDQTGMKPPNWMMQMPQDGQVSGSEADAARKKGLSNGTNGVR